MESLDLNTIVFVHNGQFDWLRRRGHFQKSHQSLGNFAVCFPDSFVEKNLVKIKSGVTEPGEPGGLDGLDGLDGA